MDYGSHLKQTIGNKNIQSKHYSKQSKFNGSDRQIRGAIIRSLSKSAHSLTRAKLIKEIPDTDPGRLTEQLQKLVAEQMVEQSGRGYHLPR